MKTRRIQNDHNLSLVVSIQELSNLQSKLRIDVLKEFVYIIYIYMIWNNIRYSTYSQAIIYNSGIHYLLSQFQYSFFLLLLCCVVWYIIAARKKKYISWSSLLCLFCSTCKYKAVLIMICYMTLTFAFILFLYLCSLS